MVLIVMRVRGFVRFVRRTRRQLDMESSVSLRCRRRRRRRRRACLTNQITYIQNNEITSRTCEIIWKSSSSVGFWPMLCNVAFSSFVSMVPLPSLSNFANASRQAAISSPSRPIVDYIYIEREKTRLTAPDDTRQCFLREQLNSGSFLRPP